MSGFPMVAIVRQTFNGRALRTGDEFDAGTQAEADDLVAVRMAVPKKPVAEILKPEAPVLVAKVVEPEPEPALTAQADETQEGSEGNTSTTGRYNRRDVRAKR